MKPIGHNDLINRINSGDNVPPNLMEDYFDPMQQYKDADRRAGHYRLEATIKAKTILRLFGKLFGRK